MDRTTEWKLFSFLGKLQCGRDLGTWELFVKKDERSMWEEK